MVNLSPGFVNSAVRSVIRNYPKAQSKARQRPGNSDLQSAPSASKRRWPLNVQQPRLVSDVNKPPSLPDVKPIVPSDHPLPLRFLQLVIDTSTAAMRFWLSSPTGATTTTTLLLLALISSTCADSPNTAAPACTVVSPQTSNFFDLRPLIRTVPRTPPATDWQARGHDYGSNFSLNICAPVLSDVSGAVSIPPAKVSNISAFYVTPLDDKIYSIGSVSTAPYFRGRKLILEYSDGSPCPTEPLKKSTLMSLLCDRDLTKPVISFVGQLNDCAYFFEVRTAAACPAVRTQALGPVTVFGIMY